MDTDNPKWPFDRAALTQIYRRYLVMVHRRTLSILHDEALAQDADHDAFARFIAYAEDHEVEHVAAFLYQTATHVALERLRRSSRQVPMREEEVRAPGSWALENKLTIAEVLSQVEPRSAQIATLYYIDGMRQEEIAQMIQVPRRTVSSHLQRFCAHALAILKDRDQDAPEQATLAGLEEVVES